MRLPPALDRDATEAMILQYRALPVSAREGGALESKILEGNLRFALTVARRFELTGQEVDFDLEDLFSHATFALLDAIREWDPRISTDPTGDNSFSGWAGRFLNKELVKVLEARAREIMETDEADRGTDKTDVIARERRRRAGLHLSDAKRKHDPMRDSVSLDAPAGEEEDDAFTLAQIITGTEADPDSKILVRSENARLLEQVACLSEQAATVVRLRFGLEGLAPHELEEIGALLKISKQRVSVVLKNALMALRDGLLAPKAAAA